MLQALDFSFVCGHPLQVDYGLEQSPARQPLGLL